jgi:excisionase family DNA binding protein
MTRKTAVPPSFPPLVVSPAEAGALLGVKRSYLYELLNKGALVFYKEGATTKITMESIHKHIAARLAESGGRLGRLGRAK